MKKFSYSLIYIVLMGISGTGNAQNMIPRKCYLHLTGSIGNEYPVEMNLVRINDTLYGDYSFIQAGKVPPGEENVGMGIPVYGKMSKGEAFSLKKWNAPGKGSFIGRFVNAQLLTGTFTGDKSEKPMNFELSEKYPEGSIAMNVYYRKASLPLLKKPGSPAASIQLSMLLPGESANPLISDSLISIMQEKFTGKRIKLTTPDKLLDGMRQIYFDNYLASNEGIYSDERAATFNWESLRFLHIFMNSSHILSFYIDHYAYTGGAHGLQTCQVTVVNLWTGKEVKLKNIFKDNTEEQLTTILSEKLHQVNHLPTSRSLKDAGFFTDTIRPTENFYITHDGIGFIYNQYDIAPYVMGTIDVFVPFRELQGILVEGGILRELLR